MKSNKIIGISMGVIVLVVGAYLVGQSQNDGYDNSNFSQDANNSISQTLAITPKVSAQEMQHSCQQVADSELRGGFSESNAANYTSSNAKSSEVRDIAYYNQNKSVCSFITLVINYPKAYKMTDPYRDITVSLYSVALLSDGSIETPNNNNAVQMVARSYTQSYTYPKPADESKYFDFNLKQIGIGTSNYRIQTLEAGNLITSSQFNSLVSDYMGTDLNSLLN